ncbi:MAG: hypothetical protein QM731_17365 [Chitinophagaceae bacterium]
MKPFLPFSIAIVVCLFTGLAGRGQANNYPFKVAMERMLWHDNVDKQQKKVLSADGTVKISKDESVNLQIADAIIYRVDELQEKIELDSTMNGQDKIKYLRNLENVLQGYNNNLNKPDFPASLAPDLVKAFKECMALDRKHESIEPVIKANCYGVARIIVDGMSYYSKDNPGLEPSRLEILRKYCGLHPDEILTELRRELNKTPNIPFADSLIAIAVHLDIRKFYDYAQARNALGNRIRNHSDPFVQIISKMANSRSGQLYLPFLDNLFHDRITFAQIDSVKDNPVMYYRLMVNTRIDYAHRLLNRDTALEMKALTERMSHTAKEHFIREINGLHTVDDDNVRFKRLEGLTAQELYYLAVLSEDEIYTSSYVRGVYPRILKQMGTPHGDSLILSVYGDYFRKFIKIAAGYNTLNNFLGTMSKENAATLMQSFVIGLEKTTGLEDAVDVADSYSSIMDKNKELANYILDEVKWSYNKNKRDNNKRGIVIYDLLKILFESADTTRKIDLSSLLGIPSIYGQSYASLTDDSGRVIQQVFFYGDEDKDGQNSFINFMTMFRNKSEWKVDDKNPDWVTITSVKGKPIWIYANRPLYGEDDPDEKAQLKLMDYMFDHKLKPTVVIHRGHSYHLASTLTKLPASAKIVVLGSCGGYNNLNEVLTICEDAHIISSKQVGTKTVNEPILQAINANLVNGTDIDWISMWRELTARFQNDAAAREKFEDYIPPYKNLGAIFIKAYRTKMDDGQ